jgi:predicted DsbA family dithiol-disulfide isomerase
VADPTAVTREITIAAAPEIVWTYLVEEDKAARWIGQAAELDARPGGLFRVHVLPAHTARGEFVELDPPRRLVLHLGLGARRRHAERRPAGRRGLGSLPVAAGHCGAGHRPGQRRVARRLNYPAGMAERMLVEVWSDLVCPWCYLGKRRLEQALERFPRRDGVDIVFRSFELEPDAPRIAASRADLLVTRYGMTPEAAEQRDAQMTALAAEAGLEYRPDLVLLGNTFDAHRVLHAAGAAGRQAAVKERLLRAYFTEGRALTDTETLVELAAEAGLHTAETRAMLAGGSFAADVRADEREAQELGITGVPFFVLHRRYAVSGAQPADVMLQALERTWAETIAGGDDAEAATA